MKEDTYSMRLYNTAIDGNWRQTVCKAKLVLGDLTGNEPERITRQIQSQLGISYDAAKNLVASIFTRKSGVS